MLLAGQQPLSQHCHLPCASACVQQPNPSRSTGQNPHVSTPEQFLPQRSVTKQKKGGNKGY